jgi:hypothetical protein
MVLPVSAFAAIVQRGAVVPLDESARQLNGTSISHRVNPVPRIARFAKKRSRDRWRIAAAGQSIERTM